jgi:hypothetical protein
MNVEVNNAVVSHLFNQITFSVPIETFSIEYYVTEDKREPVVTEFVLRLLSIAGPIDVITFKSYFGFSDAEAISVLDVLKNKGLIEFFESKVCLTGFSKASFASSNDDYPTFSKVESKFEKITCDLLSFSPIPTSKTSSPQNGIMIKVPPEVQGKSIELAKNSFQIHFDEYKKLINGYKKNSSLYSINEVESRKRSFLNIPVSIGIDSNGKLERKINPELEKIMDEDFLRLFTEKVSLELGIKVRESGIDELKSFINIFKCEFLESYISGNEFNIQKYMFDIDEKKIESPGGIVPIYGPLYFESNLNKILERIENRRSKGADERICKSAVWVTPEDKFWGRGDMFAKSIMELENKLQINANDNLFLFTRCDSGDEPEIVNRFRGSRVNELHLYKPVISEGTAMLQNLEFLLYPGGFMVTLLHISAKDNPCIKIPIGFISTQVKHQNTCQNFLYGIINSPRYLGKQLFNNKNTIANVNVTEVFEFLK